VYNTLWGVPRRLEEMQAYSALLCADALLATLITVPIRSACAAVRLIASWLTPQSSALSSNAQQRDASTCARQRQLTETVLIEGVLVAIFVVSVAVLYRQDVSVIYHSIRSQEVVKLYALFSVLELCDKLLCSFGADILEALATSAAGVAAHLAAPRTANTAALRTAVGDYLLDGALLTASVLAHSLVLLTAAITLGCAANSHASGTLLAVLLSSNFQEVKGYVFKRMNAGKVSELVCQDAVERAHLAVLLLFLACQHVEVQRSLTAGLGDSRLRTACCAVLVCEPLVDVLKHAFMAKFNDIGPAVYAQVKHQLATRAMRVQAHQAHLVLGFVPMAPAALLLRALPPAAAAAGLGAWRHAFAALLLCVVAKLATGVATRRVTAAIIHAHVAHVNESSGHGNHYSGEFDSRGADHRRGLPLAAPMATPKFYGAALSPRPHIEGTKNKHA